VQKVLEAWVKFADCTVFNGCDSADEDGEGGYVNCPRFEIRMVGFW